jgi:DNA-binding transcriptional LysR family regulator
MYSSQDLAVLVAIADTGSLRGAALALSRTQPAITQAIQRLEEAVGFSLLDRSSYRARLTERGEIFVARARVAVSHVKALQSTAILLSHGVEPRLRIAVHGAIPTQSWTELIENIPARFPSTVIEVEAGEGDLAARRLMDGDAEFALLLQAYPDRYGTRVESRTLGAVEFVNVVRADKAAQVEDGASTLPHITAADFDESTPNYGLTEAQCSWRVSNHRMKADAIIAGIGWGSVPRAMVATQLQDGTLCSLASLGARESGSRAISLYRKRDRPLGPVAEFLWNAAHERTDSREALPAS